MSLFVEAYLVHLVFESFVHCIFKNSAKGKCIAVYAVP